MLEANNKGVEENGNREGLPLLSRLQGLGHVVSLQPQAGSGTEHRLKTGFGAF